MINGPESQWTSVTGGVPQGSVLWSVLFNIFINSIQVWVHPQQIWRWHQAKLTHLKGQKPSRVIWTNLRSGPMAMSWHLNKTKCTVLHLVKATLGISKGWGMSRLRTTWLRRSWRCWWMRSWTRPGNVGLQTKRSNVVWAASKPTWPADWRREFCPSALRPHLESYILLWSPQQMKNIDFSESL